MSSDPDYAAEAAKWLDYAKENLATDEPDGRPSEDDLALAQTIGLGYAVLAVAQTPRD